MICLVGARREKVANMLLPVKLSSYLHCTSGFGGAGYIWRETKINTAKQELGGTKVLD